MKILLWHGYLLMGSGSNIYTANLARTWRGQGHEVLVMCQERAASALPFVDAHGDFNESNDAYKTHGVSDAEAPGRCTVVRPNIGDILPVYVYDEYEGFTAKRFVDLSDDELDVYTRRNVDALVTTIKRFSPDAIITGHEVMGPYIALKASERTGASYLAKLHGSALEYAVKLQDRYRAYARLGLAGADVVVGGSRYMLDEAAAAVPGWEEKGEVVNPGCDVDLFTPAPERPPGAPIVGYVGKLMASKGVHNLIAACGMVDVAFRLVVIGYGGFERGLRDLAHALASGDHDRSRAIAERGEQGRLDELTRFIEEEAGDRFCARMKRRDIEFTGRLDHEPLARVLPTFELLVVPSVVPEAFGMVAAEAAACGVLPVVPGHSGISEIGAAIESELRRPGLLTYDPADPIHGIAARIGELLSLDEAERRRMGAATAALARARWSWDVVANRLLALATR